MTRIIGGIAGSRQLASPAKSTRPTSDRIRESIFNRLAARDLIFGARVLDLYAGTGALALEAISREAKSAMMVERDGKAAAVCVANSSTIQKALEKEGFYDQMTKVANKSVVNFLASDAGEYDLVFIDPPFDGPWFESALKAAAAAVPLGGWVYLEAPVAWTDEALGVWGLKLERHLKAGAVHAHLLQRTA